ncbi:hypothetical protein B7463_g11485, partial [Scytalidium lignicola]
MFNDPSLAYRTHTAPTPVPVTVLTVPAQYRQSKQYWCCTHNPRAVLVSTGSTAIRWGRAARNEDYGPVVRYLRRTAAPSDGLSETTTFVTEELATVQYSTGISTASTTLLLYRGTAVATGTKPSLGKQPSTLCPSPPSTSTTQRPPTTRPRPHTATPSATMTDGPAFCASAPPPSISSTVRAHLAIP